MAAKIDPAIPADLREVVLTRTFDAPRKLVWQAWTDPEHIREWWGPLGYDVPHPRIDLRPGGKMDLDMRDPDGKIRPDASVIRESRPPEKLVFSSLAFVDKDGNAAFELLTTVTLKEQNGRTAMTLKVDVVKAAAAMLPGLKGLKQAFQTVLKLAEHVDLVRWGMDGAKVETSFVVPGDRPVAVVRRTFDAPRDLVWQALTDPKMRAEWWGPARYKVNVRELDARPGGKWRIDHLDVDGKVFSFSGEFTEVRKPTRLVNTFRFENFPPAVETITLSETEGKTTLTNVTSVDSFDNLREWVDTGMESGARESMDRLAGLLSRMKLGARANDAHQAFAEKQKGATMSRQVTHATFKIERTFEAPPKTVFRAFADKDAKDRWFAGPPDWITTENSMDFRVGGREVNGGGPKGGPVSFFDCHYYDIVPDERIVYAYEMYLDDVRISVSVATIEFKKAGAGTRLVLTEQGAYLDGFDNPALREEGTRGLIEALARSLNERSVAA